MRNIFIAVITLSIFNLANASSAMYQTEVTGLSFIVKNAANQEEAAAAALSDCEGYSGLVGSCTLSFKTEYGGYAAVATGYKTQGYAFGKTSQDRADKLSMSACTDRNPKPETCKIKIRYFDNGRKVRMYVPINQ
jgi:hypothetical protein